MNVLVIFNARLLDESTDCPGALLCVEGKIRSVFHGFFTDVQTVRALTDSVLKEDGIEHDAKIDFVDAGGLCLTPAFVDMHVHLREPGFTQKENIESGLNAAVAGGYGTVVAMPNTNPVISSAEQVLENHKKADSLMLANLFQSTSITKDFGGKDISHIEKLDRELVPLITEDGREVASSAVMLEAMRAASEKNIIVSCHCEEPTLAEAARPYRQHALKLMKKYGLPAWGGSAEAVENVPEDILEEIDISISQANELLELAENIATDRNIELAKAAGCHIHLCHVSTEAALESVRRAKEWLEDENAIFYEDSAEAAYATQVEQQPYLLPEPIKPSFAVTCEVTPHHIALCGTDEPYIRAFVNPPLRPENDRISLIEGIRSGVVDVIATDHAPHTLEEKSDGAPGFSGIECAFGVCNTVLVKNGQIPLTKLSKLMSANPARILGLNKGLLKCGYDADLTLLNPDEQWKVDPKTFCSKGKATPFDGWTLKGKVKSVFISGKKIFEG